MPAKPESKCDYVVLEKFALALLAPRMSSLRNFFRLGALLILGTTAAHAHDALQSSTNIRLWPDQMEVTVLMARASSLSLVDNSPNVPITTENFADTYQALLLKSAPTLVEITLDSKEIKPRSMAVSLPDETDVEFDFVYDRPANGRRMQVTISFLKKMPAGFMDSLEMSEATNILGYGDQSDDDPVWEIKIGDPPIKLPFEKNPPIPSASIPVPASLSAATAQLSSPVTVASVSYPASYLIPAIVLPAVILLLIILFVRKKAGRR